jgi:acyl-CoA thioester hydrolase
VVRTELRVIYGDTDQMAVVYYANYLRFMEAGRNEFIRAHGLGYRDFEERFSLRLPVAEAKVSYRLPARYDDVIAVETSLVELKRASVKFGYRIVRGDDLLATGETVHACVDLGGRIRRLPAELVALLDVAPSPTPPPHAERGEGS